MDASEIDRILREPKVLPVPVPNVVLEHGINLVLDLVGATNEETLLRGFSLC